MLSKIRRLIYLLEDSTLVLALVLLILLGMAQIVLRNTGMGSIMWMDSASRILVLWLAFFGAMRASRDQKHIAIDALALYAGPKMRRIMHFFMSVSCAVICGAAAWFSYHFVAAERTFGDIAFLHVPEWLALAIIPFGLAIITLRFVLYSLTPPDIVHDEP